MFCHHSTWRATPSLPTIDIRRVKSDILSEPTAPEAFMQNFDISSHHASGFCEIFMTCFWSILGPRDNWLFHVQSKRDRIDTWDSMLTFASWLCSLNVRTRSGGTSFERRGGGGCCWGTLELYCWRHSLLSAVRTYCTTASEGTGCLAVVQTHHASPIWPTLAYGRPWCLTSSSLVWNG